MSFRPVIRHGLLAGTLLFLVWLAWQVLSGAFRQVSRSRTLGQKVETVTQVECGLLIGLVVLTCFRWRRCAPAVRTLWSISLATTAGLSSLVWGPPMPLIALLFIAVSLFMTRAVICVLRTALAA